MRRSTSVSAVPWAVWTRPRVMRPVVTVPVLSRTTVSILRAVSRTSGPLMRMPSCAPRPVPAMRAVGVASPRAQGQAMISTATAAVNEAVTSSVASSWATSVPRAISSTTGTKTAEIRSARRWAAALPLCASSTSLAIRASRVSEPTLVASTTSRPETFRVAPVTESPGAVSTGRDSPVSMEVSTAEEPSTAVPSVAIFSPGRTTNRSPTWSPSTATRTSVTSGPGPVPGRRTVTSFAPRRSRARRAEPAFRLDRASR